MRRVFDIAQNSIVAIDQDEVSFRFACSECDLGYLCEDAELGELMGRRKVQPCRHAWISLKILCEPEYWDEEKKRYPKRLYRSCPRCGGSGHYSYCQMYGTTCFQCRGWYWIPRVFKSDLRGSAASVKEARVGDSLILGMVLYDVIRITWAENVRRRMEQLIQGAPAMPEHDTQTVTCKARISGVEKRYWRHVFAPDHNSSVTTVIEGVTTTAPGLCEVQRVPVSWRGQDATAEQLAVVHEVNRAELMELALKRDYYIPGERMNK